MEGCNIGHADVLVRLLFWRFMLKSLMLAPSVYLFHMQNTSVMLQASQSRRGSVLQQYTMPVNESAWGQRGMPKYIVLTLLLCSSIRIPLVASTWLTAPATRWNQPTESSVPDPTHLSSSQSDHKERMTKRH